MEEDSEGTCGTAALVSCEELQGSEFVCYCHPEDLLRWSLYSGDYVVLRGGACGLRDEECAGGWASGTQCVCVITKLSLKGGEVPPASCDVPVLPKQEVLQQLQRFFGTVAGQSPRTLQDVADEEDLDVDEEVPCFECVWSGFFACCPQVIVERC
eukprot:Skav229953  [mRNA]  locus=scaffold2665:275490:278386:- [translate_table: standard]